MARRSAGLLQLCVSTTSTGLFFCRYTRITACNIPAPDRQAETLGGINKHAKANALFARQAKIPLPVASCHCYFVYCYLTFFRTSWSLLESPSHTLFLIHGSTACACQQPPQDETIESRKETSSIIGPIQLPRKPTGRSGNKFYLPLLRGDNLEPQATGTHTQQRE